MRETFSLGRIAGIRIGMNWSVLVIVALLTYGLAAARFPAVAPGRPLAEYVVAAVLTAVAYLGSLLAHELAHALVARRNGLAVEGITLWLLGGVSRLQGEVPDPGAEVRVAGAGPLVSLVLGVAFVLAAWLAYVQGVAVAALAWLGAINVVLAVFNAIPAAPLDGGRLLRAVLRDAACPLPEVARATPDEPVADVLPRLNACSEGRALVFADGQLAGILSQADVNRALERLNRR